MSRWIPTLCLLFTIAAAPAFSADEAAEKGPTDAVAQFELGQKLLYGRGVGKDPAAANDWFRKAGEQGHVRAMVNLGISLLKGRGTPVDPAEALRWLQRAAEQNHPRAQVEVALARWEGYAGLKRDRVAAASFMALAAENGSPLAKGMITGYMRDLSKEQRKEAHQLARAWRVERKLFTREFREMEPPAAPAEAAQPAGVDAPADAADVSS